MVKDDLRTLMMWVIVVVVVLQAMKCDLFDSMWQKNQAAISEKQKHYSETLSAAEIDEFIRFWPQYNKLGLEALPNSSLSITEKPETDWKTETWFIYHQLDAQRFMYVRQRLKELLKEIDEKRTAKNIAKQLSGLKDELSQEMSAQHQRYADAIKLNEAEVKIIKEREAELKQLFKIYP